MSYNTKDIIYSDTKEYKKKETELIQMISTCSNILEMFTQSSKVTDVDGNLKLKCDFQSTVTVIMYHIIL